MTATLRPIPRLTPEEATASDRAVDVFLAAIGGQQALTEALTIAAPTPEADQVLTLLLDPRYAGTSLKKLCAMAGLTVVDLFAAYKSSLIARAHLQAYQIVSQKLVAVVDDVMTRAAPHPVACTECAGSGQTATVPRTPCPVCAGHGQLLQLPDLDRQKLALELAQLIQKSGGVNIALSASAQAGASAAAGGGSGGGLVELQQAAREILRGPRAPILDVAPLDPPAPADQPEG